MKKILTLLTAVVLLVATMFTATSCGGWDMSDIKSTIKELDKKEKIGGYYLREGEDETGTKAVKKSYTVYSDDDADDRGAQT